MRELSGTGSDYQQVFSALMELALDLRWSWNHSAHLMWRKLDPELWDRTRNPILVLQTISRERLMRVVETPDFNNCVQDLRRQKENENSRPAPPSCPFTSPGSIVYFSMEYMLTEALPIYSGGLGNVAGDQLKAASDLHAPVIGVGLLFQQGYFRQEISANGEQRSFFPFNNPDELPITPVRTEEGEWVRVKISRPNYTLWLRAWQAKIGATTLYLLDTNDPANDPLVRLIGSELYGGGPQLRLRQEIILGIGGWRLLRQLGITPTVCHLNEGHAAFAVLERARYFMQDQGQDFWTALAATRVGNVFTTHTPVAAGFDRFAPRLMESHLKFYTDEHLRIPFSELLDLGRQNPGDKSEPFNMAYFAIRGSGAVNGVSRLHGQVSRRILQPLFPRWPEAEVPVGHVTNGVHVPTWTSLEAASLWNEASARGRNNITPAAVAGPIPPDILADISDRRLWELRCRHRAKLIAYARRRLIAQRAAVGALGRLHETLDAVLNPDILTFAFARRFAEYKRPTLLLRDPDRFARILEDPSRPAQLVLAGKAHPADDYGQSLIKQWNEFIQKYQLQTRVVFLADYDMHLTQILVRGADLWINTPRRPWEASGTSGMKILVNGGLNISELDGWWAEAYTPEVGWAIGDPIQSRDDAQDAEQLYTLLENEVKPAFYERDVDGVPSRWVARMRASMTQLTPQFSANRVVCQYMEQYYKPAAVAYARRAADGAAIAAGIAAWRQRVEESWRFVAIRSRHTTPCGEPGPEMKYEIEVEVELGPLAPSEVAVELFADSGDSMPFRKAMEVQGRGSGNSSYLFRGAVPAVRPESHYTARVIPCHPDMQFPLELNCITWEK